MRVYSHRVTTQQIPPAFVGRTNTVSTQYQRKERLIFKKGDRIVHPKHGAGIVTGSREIQYDDETRQYLCMDMRDDANSVVMIPYDRLEDVDLRPVTIDMEMVRELMLEEPTELHDHYRTRQSRIEDRIKGGEPNSLVTALRDLCWREHVDRLTKVDKQILKRIRKRLTKELALSASCKVGTMRHHLRQAIQEAMEAHSQNHTATAS